MLSGKSICSLFKGYSEQSGGGGGAPAGDTQARRRWRPWLRRGSECRVRSAARQEPGAIEEWLVQYKRYLGNQVLTDDEHARALADAEEYLCEEAACNRESGFPPAEAERRAAARFGSARLLAARCGHALAPKLSLTSVLLRWYLYGALLVGVFLIEEAIVGFLSETLLALGVGAWPAPAEMCAKEPTPDCYEFWSSMNSGFWGFIGASTIAILGAWIAGMHWLLLRYNTRGRADYSAPSRAYLLLATLLFGLLTLASVASIFVAAVVGADGWVAHDVSGSIVSAALATLYARATLALWRSRPRRLPPRGFA